MRGRRLRGRRLQEVHFADRMPRGLFPRAARLMRRLRVRARQLPVFIALPLAAVTLQKPAPPLEVHPEARAAISRILSPFCPPPYLIENCPSPGAAALRDSINAMAHGGMTADSIVERVLAAYGEEYRGMPKRSGRGLLAWTIPPAVLVAGLALVVLVLRRLKGPAPRGVQAELTDEDRERLDAALAEMEEMEETE